MQISTLLQPNGVASGAQDDPSVTPEIDGAGEVAQKVSFRALMEDGDQLSAENDSAVFDTVESQDVLVGDATVETTAKAFAPIDLMQGAATHVLPEMEQETVAPVVGDAVSEGALGAEAEAAEDLAATIEMVPVLHMRPDQSSILANGDRFETGTTSDDSAPAKPDVLVDGKSGLPHVPVAPLGVSHMEQSVTLRATQAMEMTVDTATQSTAPQMTAKSAIESHVSAISSAPLMNGTPLSEQTSGEAAVMNGVGVDVSKGISSDSIVLKTHTSDDVSVVPKDVSSETASAGKATTQPTQGMDLNTSGRIPIPSGQREVPILDALPPSGAPLEAMQPTGQQKAPSPDHMPAPNQGPTAVQTVMAAVANSVAPKLEAGSEGGKVKKSDDTTTSAAPSQAQPQTAVAPTPPPTPVVASTAFSLTAQRMMDAQQAADAGQEAPRFDETATTPSADTPANPKASSTPTAAERGAELFANAIDVATRQIAIEGDLRPQELEMTSFYGGSDSTSARLDQLSQLDPLTQTSRVELPARLAAQIADVARQLPDGPIEISLSPEELGKVKLTFQVSENGAMNVVVAAERPETLEFMRRNIDSLLAEFSDLGYEGSSFQFQQDDQSGSGDNANPSGASRASGGIDTVEGVDASMAATNASAPVRLHLDGTSGMDLRL